MGRGTAALAIVMFRLIRLRCDKSRITCNPILVSTVFRHYAYVAGAAALLISLATITAWAIAGDPVVANPEVRAFVHLLAVCLTIWASVRISRQLAIESSIPFSYLAFIVVASNLLYAGVAASAGALSPVAQQEYDQLNMSPTILNKQLVRVDRWAYKFRAPRYNEIVSVGGYLMRVVGQPGDTVEVKKGVLFLNGKSVERQSAPKTPERAPEKPQNVTGDASLQGQPQGGTQAQTQEYLEKLPIMNGIHRYLSMIWRFLNLERTPEKPQNVTIILPPGMSGDASLHATAGWHSGPNPRISGEIADHECKFTMV